MGFLSFQPPIKRQVIMLPLHGQATAAVEVSLGRIYLLDLGQEAMFLLNSQIEFLSSSFCL